MKKKAQMVKHIYLGKYLFLEVDKIFFNVTVIVHLICELFRKPETNLLNEMLISVANAN